MPGSLLLMLGAWMASECIRAVLYILRTQAFDSWFTADTALRIAAAVFFMWVGARRIRRVGQEVPGTKIGWGRLLLGISFIYANIRGHSAPTPGALQPDNASEAAGMQIMTALIYVAGVALIFGAFWRQKQKPAEILPEQSSSAAAQK
ncbi:MAG TPA: hypothetical protein VI488_07065 [Candidatus Angelobacter sp.]